MSRWLIRQKGVTQVEFTLIALAVLLVIFSIIEFALYFYSIQMANEVTRRAARLATVCYIADRDDIPELPAVKGLYPPGFSSENLTISYLDKDGDSVDVSGFLTSPPADTDALNATFATIRFVKAEADYTFKFLVLSLLINAVGASPEFQTILPAESLGVLRPEDGLDAVEDC
ncbi:pilus assembly protein TadE [Vibrio natriegens]|uniref:TadE family protein n=1 Tax=Vibrio natriegens TaxID=691 RepID=UPI000804662A|nr:TadE family protein [Vibrio natriegens]ANQ22458.1 pilus assembly protein TadE [Vibrio natriegens]ANQ27160.1 pilus assembly protein TadE [Vibrio natriegens]MCY9878449.1 pilus assembly protein [Vibrio natriegens]